MVFVVEPQTPRTPGPGASPLPPARGHTGLHDLIRLKIASNPWCPQSDR